MQLDRSKRNLAEMHFKIHPPQKKYNVRKDITFHEISVWEDVWSFWKDSSSEQPWNLRSLCPSPKHSISWVNRFWAARFLCSMLEKDEPKKTTQSWSSLKIHTKLVRSFFASTNRWSLETNKQEILKIISKNDRRKPGRPTKTTYVTELSWRARIQSIYLCLCMYQYIYIYVYLSFFNPKKEFACTVSMYCR